MSTGDPRDTDEEILRTRLLISTGVKRSILYGYGRPLEAGVVFSRVKDHTEAMLLYDAGLLWTKSYDNGYLPVDDYSLRPSQLTLVTWEYGIMVEE